MLEDVGIEIPSELQSIMLLSSLPEDYENFCVAIESRDQIPTVDLIKGQLIEEEARRQGCNTKGDGTTSALTTKKAHQSKRQTYKNRSSTRGDPEKRKKFDGECFNCGKYGRPASRCLKKGDGGKASTVQKSKDHEKEDSLIAISALSCSTEKYE